MAPTKAVPGLLLISVSFQKIHQKSRFEPGELGLLAPSSVRSAENSRFLR